MQFTSLGVILLWIKWTKLENESIKQFETLDGIKIESFSDGKRTYGWVKCVERIADHGVLIAKKIK